MKYLIIGLLSITVMANDDLDIHIEPPIGIPDELAPIKPIPPVGTEECQQEYVCSQYGDECRWVVVCR